MNSGIKIIAIILIVAGVLGLAYGQFSYTKEVQYAKVGPVKVIGKQNRTVNIPTWVGIGGILVGASLLFVTRKKK
ncbi:MAG: LPXTG cell wall anchor domain-containing protein [bacterium]